MNRLTAMAAIRFLQVILITIAATLLNLFCTVCYAAQLNEQQLQLGATVYQQRCVLCHGDHGMGEGLLPIVLAEYPATNLFKKKYVINIKDIDKLREVIAQGSILEGISEYMPPWKDELTWNELESVVHFTLFLYQSPKKAYKYILKAADKSVSAKYVGQKIFVTRCAMCHGRHGEGNGRLAKVIRTPPPFNLTKSTASSGYLQQIIIKGGAAMKRSKHMPPWGQELTSAEINSVVVYILKLRN